MRRQFERHYRNLSLHTGPRAETAGRRVSDRTRDWVSVASGQQSSQPSSRTIEIVAESMVADRVNSDDLARTNTVDEPDEGPRFRLARRPLPAIVAAAPAPRLPIVGRKVAVEIDPSIIAPVASLVAVRVDDRHHHDACPNLPHRVFRKLVEEKSYHVDALWLVAVEAAEDQGGPSQPAELDKPQRPPLDGSSEYAPSHCTFPAGLPHGYLHSNQFGPQAISTWTGTSSGMAPTILSRIISASASTALDGVSNTSSS